MTNKSKLRKAEILRVALALASKTGYMQITRQAVADRAACSPALVSEYFATMPQLRRAVMSAAIAERELTVLAQGLAARDSKARSAPEALRREAVAGLM